MDDPLLYSQINELQKVDVRNFLQNHLNLRNFNENSQILDVGSGDGSVTRMLSKFLGANLIAIDSSQKMVEFARGTNGEERVEFRTGDVTVEEDLAQFFGQIDGVFSFFCLHWVQDQRTAWKNIWKLLKPSGQVFAISIADNVIYEVYEIQAKNPKWSKYFSKIDDYVSCYRNLENPAKDLQNLLENCEFSVELCRTVNRKYIFQTEDFLYKFILAVGPFIKEIPENLQAEYMQDFRDILRNFQIGGDQFVGIEKRYQILQVIATKLQ